MKLSINYKAQKTKKENKLSQSLTSQLTSRIKIPWLAINLSFLTFFATINSVSASPVCYMIDPNGNRINLSSLCGSAKSSPISKPQNNPTITDSEKPDSETTETENTPENPESQSENGEKSTNADNNSEEEIDRSELPVIEKNIPLIQRQRSPKATDD